MFEKLEEAYIEYLEFDGISPAWAISKESSIWLAEKCSQSNFELIYDFGAGFTSWVLREYSEAHVISIDTKIGYLETAKRFAKDSGEFVLLDEFIESGKHEPADLIVYDIEGRIREATLPFAANLINSGGLFFADDAHRQKDLTNFTAAFPDQEILLLKQLTDEYGRFPAICLVS